VLLLPLCLSFVVYLSIGRIHWIAEIRRKNLVVDIATPLNRLFTILRMSDLAAMTDLQQKDAEELTRITNHFWITVRVWAFFILSALYLIFNMLIYFILHVNRIFFSSLIIARSYQRSGVGMDYR
jgi:hypothetical protein